MFSSSSLIIFVKFACVASFDGRIGEIVWFTCQSLRVFPSNHLSFRFLWSPLFAYLASLLTYAPFTGLMFSFTLKCSLMCFASSISFSASSRLSS